MKSVIKFLLFSTLLFASCKKTSDEEKFKKSIELTQSFSSEVAQQWHDLQLKFLRLPTGTNPYGMNGNRYFAYSGIALYESVLPGMPGNKSLFGQLTNMPVMPQIESGKSYHWPSSANAALAFLNRNFYATTSNMESIDSLENALNSKYSSEVTPE